MERDLRKVTLSWAGALMMVPSSLLAQETATFRPDVLPGAASLEASEQFNLGNWKYSFPAESLSKIPYTHKPYGRTPATGGPITATTPVVRFPVLIPPRPSNRGSKDPPGTAENRGQGGMGGSPVVLSVVTAESIKARANPGGMAISVASLTDDKGFLWPAWGEALEVAKCNASLVGLREAGRIAVYKPPVDERRKQLERDFLDSCLGTPDTRVNKRLGRLVRGGNTLCTVFFLTSSRGITARHCLYKPKLNGLIVNLSPVYSNVSSLSVEFGSMAEPQTIAVNSIEVQVSTSQTQKLSRASTDEYRLPAIQIPKSVVQKDFIVIELEKPFTNDTFTQVRWAHPALGEKIILPAFHTPTKIQKKPQDSGFRQQVYGYCQVIQPNVESCVTHGCSTTPGTSGAPMFVERSIAGVSELHLVGIHTSGKREDSFCPGDPNTDTILNYGVRLSAKDLGLTE